MQNHSLVVIWLASLVLPCTVFLAGSRCPSGWTAVLRATVAVLAGWMLNVAYADVAQTITTASAKDQGGAAMAFAAVLGWVPSALLVLVTWVAAIAVKRWRQRRHSSKSESLGIPT